MTQPKFSRKTRFISVEVVIKTNFPAKAWMEWFTRSGEPVQKVKAAGYKWNIYFSPLAGKNANQAIKRLCRLIQNLPPEVRMVWDRAGQREFFAGYDIGEEPFLFTDHLDAKTLRAMADLNAGYRYALYQAKPTDRKGQTAEFSTP